MCSRLTYLGPNGCVITGRSMDWMVPLETSMWALPAGIERDGASRANPLRWRSRYGSVVTTAYDSATTDGMNTEGLVVNWLYLADAQYPKRDESVCGLSLAGWAQYVLDSFATTAEAVDALAAEPFQPVEFPVPGGFSPATHLAIADASGDSAVLEYLDGRLVVHHGREYQVMTNEPSYDQQLALSAYWQQLDGTMLPGTDRPADRFVRATYYLDRLVSTDDEVRAPAAVLSVVRNVSVPMMAEANPDAPNVAPTIWRTVADAGRRRYFFDDTLSPSVFWVDLERLELGEGAPAMRLAIDDGPVRSDEVSADFVAQAAPFAFRPES